VTLLVQFRIALQVRQTVGAQFKNNWKICINNVCNNIWALKIQLWSYRQILIWFDLFVDDQKSIYLILFTVMSFIFLQNL